MRGISICFVVVMSTTVSSAEVGRLMGVTKRSSLFPISKEMALGGERYQLNDQEERRIHRRYQLNDQEDRAMDRRYQLNNQEDRKMDRRYHLDDPQKATSNKRYRLEDPEEIDGKYQLKDMNSLFLIHIPSRRKTMARKRANIRSCWFQYYTKCPRESFSPKSLPPGVSSGFTSYWIIQRAVLQALGLKLQADLLNVSNITNSVGVKFSRLA